MSNKHTWPILLVCVAAASLWSSEASAQCKGGGRQGPGQSGGQTMTSRQTMQNTLSTGQGTTQSQRRTLTAQQQGTGLTTQQVTDGGQTALRTSRQLQQGLVALTTALQNLQDDPNLTDARQRRLRATVTAALKQIDRQDQLLTALEDQRQNGSLSSTDLQRLSTLISQQAALTTALEDVRTATTQALAIRTLQAQQSR